MGNGRPFSLVALAFLAGLGGSWLFSILPGPLRQASPPLQETAYERVMRTQTLRCGYAIRPPILMKDMKTGQLTGIFHDYVEALGKALNLKIEWAEEVGWADFPTALENRRIDAFCAGAWTSAARARLVDLAQPVYYEPLYAYVRADDFRFDGNLQKADDPSVKVISIEGGVNFFLSTKLFPKAQQMHLSPLVNVSDHFVNIVSRKADLSLQAPVSVFDFQKSNPGTIRKVEASSPIRVSGVSLAIAGGQDRLRSMLSIATNELLYSGEIERILATYVDRPEPLFLSPAHPYRLDKTQDVSSRP